MGFSKQPATEGARLFAAWLAGPPKKRQEAVAEELGVAQQTISAWARGTVVPGVLHRVRLKLAAQIPAEAWFPNPDEHKLTEDEERELAGAFDGDTAPLGTPRAVETPDLARAKGIA